MLALLLLSACAPRSAGPVHPSPTPLAAVQTPSDSSSPDPTPTATPTPSHVFVIVMENRSYSQAINYLAMTSGSTWGITDDGFHNLPAGGLGAQLTAARIEWRAYMEGMTGSCLRNGNGYALKHNPFAYYGSACPAQVVPFSQFSRDMAAAAPRFVWITPNMCHDGHDCSTAIADQWLAETVPTILASSAWQNNGVLFITWDEGEDSANSVLTLAIQPDPLNHSSARPYNHYSLLAAIEDRFGLARLGSAAQAEPMTDLLATKPPPRLRNGA